MADARDRLIVTTCELFERQGYHATGLNQIIRESGTPKGSLYYYFPGGKEELAAAAITHAGALMLTHMQTQLALEDDPVQAIAQFMMGIAKHIVNGHYQSGGPLTTVALEIAATNEHLGEVCRKVYASWQGAFADCLVQGGFDGVEAQRIAAWVMAIIEGGAMLCRVHHSPVPLESAANEFLARMR